MARWKPSLIYISPLLILLIYLKEVTPQRHGIKSLPMLMPNVQPLQNETYLCTAFKAPKKGYEYIVEFHPNATMETAHHILIYGCLQPGLYQRDTPRYVWDCGEMATHSSGFAPGPVCAAGSQIIYAWAMEAPELILPDSVGFKIGEGTGINYLVLQVHYANVNRFINGETDKSGIIVNILPSKNRRVSKSAGVLLLGTAGSIPSHRTVHMETACRIEEPLEIHPFAFRTHTHKLGKAVAGYKIDDRGEWKLIGKHNPQEPQMFYPVEDNNIVIRQGDIVAARCTMYNFRNHRVDVGGTAKDEMCNFYMMYYVDGDKPLDQKYCFSRGPPSYYWNSDEKFDGIPPEVDINASKL